MKYSPPDRLPGGTLEEVAMNKSRSETGTTFDIFARIWENLNARLTRPINLRKTRQGTLDNSGSPFTGRLHPGIADNGSGL
jgi:hypothetical protein